MIKIKSPRVKSFWGKSDTDLAEKINKWLEETKVSHFDIRQMHFLHMTGISGEYDPAEEAFIEYLVEEEQ